MRIRRPILIPTILALGASGSILTASVMPAATAFVQTTQVEASTTTPFIYFHT
jgi:hypothetical protein